MSPHAIVLTVIVLGTVPAAVIDLRTRRVPNAVTVSLAVAGVLLALAGIGRVGLVASLLGLSLGCALMLPGHLIGGTGAGDVKLFAAVGALLGPVGILSAFLYTAIAGGLLALLVALRRRRGCQIFNGIARLITNTAGSKAAIEHPSEDNRFAYAPAIAVGAIFAAMA